MYPTILELGPITLYSYGLMIAIGFLTVLFLIQRDAKRCGIDANALSDTAFWVLILGVAATRVAHIILYPQHYSWTDPIGWINVTNGGLVFQGAIPVGIIFCYWNLKRRGVPFLKAVDVVMPYVPIGQAFGRMGCLLKGCCHGERADTLPWAISFPPESPAYHTHQQHYADFPADAAWSYPVHPTQLYSVLLLLGLSAALLFARKHRPFLGVALPLYFVLYGVCRFIVEIYRGDGNPTRTYLGVELTSQQAFCVIMIVVGIGFAVVMHRLRDKKADLTFP